VSVELRAWAMSRIRACREYEEDVTRRTNILSARIIEAGRERMTLEAVLRILDGAEDKGD
jgi:hypothetical protein